MRITGIGTQFQFNLNTMDKEQFISCNFKELDLEVEFDVWKKYDVSKDVANVVHQGTDDIGIDDKARELYYQGEVSLSPKEASVFLSIIMRSNLLASIKRAAEKILLPKE